MDINQCVRLDTSVDQRGRSPINDLSFTLIRECVIEVLLSTVVSSVIVYVLVRVYLYVCVRISPHVCVSGYFLTCVCFVKLDTPTSDFQ